MKRLQSRKRKDISRAAVIHNYKNADGSFGCLGIDTEDGVRAQFRQNVKKSASKSGHSDIEDGRGAVVALRDVKETLYLNIPDVKSCRNTLEFLMRNSSLRFPQYSGKKCEYSDCGRIGWVSVTCMGNGVEIQEWLRIACSKLPSMEVVLHVQSDIPSTTPDADGRHNKRSNVSECKTERRNRNKVHKLRQEEFKNSWVHYRNK